MYPSQKAMQQAMISKLDNLGTMVESWSLGIPAFWRVTSKHLYFKRYICKVSSNLGASSPSEFKNDSGIKHTRAPCETCIRCTAHAHLAKL